MPKKRKYHGWLEVERGEKGMKDYFICVERYDEVGHERKVLATFRDPSSAIDFWDKKIGTQVKLQDTPLGAYRVFTEVEE